MPTGYSGTPLATKLGVKDAQRTWRSGMPATVAAEIAESPFTPQILKIPAANLEMAHLFVTERSNLTSLLARIRPLLAPAGIIWISWPKKSSGVATNINEHIVREEAFPLGLVDIKVCAVDEVWSGLKLMIRISERLRNKPSA